MNNKDFFKAEEIRNNIHEVEWIGNWIESSSTIDYYDRDGNRRQIKKDKFNLVKDCIVNAIREKQSEYLKEFESIEIKFKK